MHVIAHRGDSQNAPENTLKAFERAWSAGADGVELDIRLSRDGQVVVFHDPDGRRLTGDSRKIAECDWETLQSWRIWGEGIPLLSDVLDRSPQHALTMIEIKTGPEILPSLEKILAAFPDQTYAILTFQPEVAVLATERYRAVWLNVERYMTPELDALLVEAKRHRLAGVSVGWSDRMSPEVVRRIHDAGFPLAVWTVNRMEDVHRAIDWGVDLLMTDCPADVVPVVKHA